MGCDKLCHRRNLSQFQPVNRDAALAKSAFEFGRGTGRLRIRAHREKSRLHEQPSDLAKVFGLVRRDPHDPMWANSSMKRSEEMFRHNTLRRMAPFRPGIE